MEQSVQVIRGCFVLSVSVALVSVSGVHMVYLEWVSGNYSPCRVPLMVPACFGTQARRAVLCPQEEEHKADDELDPLGMPKGWRQCPRMGIPIDRFIPMKVCFAPAPLAGTPL